MLVADRLSAAAGWCCVSLAWLAASCSVLVDTADVEPPCEVYADTLLVVR